MCIRDRVSASASHLLELRFQEHGIDHVGLSVHVPQYLAESYLPQAAVAALEHLSAVTGRTLPTDELREASRDVIRQIDEQANSSPEVQAVIESMEPVSYTHLDVYKRQVYRIDVTNLEACAPPLELAGICEGADEHGA